MHKKHKLKTYTYITYKKLFNHMNEYYNESLESKQRTYDLIVIDRKQKNQLLIKINLQMIEPSDTGRID